MKKLLGIVVVSLLLIIFSSTAQAACTLKQLQRGTCDYRFPERSFFDKVGDALDDINPLNYFEKRKKCQDQADRMDTVAEGKRRYKNCMK